MRLSREKLRRKKRENFRDGVKGGRMTTGMDKLTIAVVDDDLSMVQMVREMISTTGFYFQAFELGADLLKSASLERFDVIILELSLPDIEGFEIIEMLAEKKIRAKVIVVSGHEYAVVRAAKLYGQSFGLNMGQALAKPFSKDDLFAVLELPA
jgi:FixJ family two-component response regulator